MSNKPTVLLFLAATAVALALRLPKLEQRPMHGDEAVHAIKFGQLLEQGFYRYDSFEYHGPTLNYLTLIPAWLGSEHTLTQVKESTLRVVPVFFGTLLVLSAAILVNGLGKTAASIAALLTAISPAMAYYSRYYIQEMLLVCFTFAVLACGYRYLRRPGGGWAIATGVFLGLMHATKETSVIAWAAMLLALMLIAAERSKKEGLSILVTCTNAVKGRHVAAALCAAAVVSILFFSSFFSNAQGVLDSVLTYKTYLSRAGHDPAHIHPWHYYLNVLAFFSLDAGTNPVWSEALILLLAMIGGVAAFQRRACSRADADLPRFLTWYALFMTIFYSLIPYKTPWNLISFLHAMILLAGFGAAALMQMLSHKIARMLVMALMIFAGTHLAWQAYLANFKYYEDPANPYVYAHPVNDVFAIVKRVEEIARIHPDGSSLYMQVICPGDDYWPLPWYLRAFRNIGWWNQVDEGVAAAPLILASPKVEPALLRRLYELPPPGQRHLYVPLFNNTYMELRPRVELRGYVRKEWWDRLQEPSAP